MSIDVRSTTGKVTVALPPKVTLPVTADFDPPYLYSTGTGSYLTTPNAPEFGIDGDYRYTSKVRLIRGSITAATFIQHGINSLGWAVEYRCDTVNNNAWRMSDWVNGGAQATHNLVTNPELDTTYLPDKQDAYVGYTSLRPLDRTRYTGIKSSDGTTWSDAGTPYVAANQLVQGGPINPLYIGQYWRGRIYWSQFEAINRAQLVFPGTPYNYLTTPNLWSVSSDTASVEVLARVSCSWIPPYDFAGILYIGSRLGLRYVNAGNQIQFYSYAANGSATTAQGAVPATWTSGQMVWIRGTNDGTTITLEWAPDSITVPTVWTQLRSPMSAVGPGLRAGAAVSVATDGAVGSSRVWTGRIARVIVRDVIGGPNVLDISENNPGSSMATPTTFLATSGQTVTVNERPASDLVFPGVTGNYLSVPNSAPLQITGDIEIVFRAMLPDWSPVDLSGVVGRWQSGGNYSWLVRFAQSGALWFYASADGVNNFSYQYGITNTLTDGAIAWFKVTRSAATGVITMFRAADQTNEPTTWTTLGSSTTSPSGPLFAGIAPAVIGNATGLSLLNGRIPRVIVRNGIAGTVVLDVNEDFVLVNSTSFNASVGGVVTVFQTAGNTICQADPTWFPIVQPQPNKVVWRFDATEYPGTGTTYTDPRGRVWTLTNANAIVKLGPRPPTPITVPLPKQPTVTVPILS